jgi:hypothetical protein
MPRFERVSAVRLAAAATVAMGFLGCLQQCKDVHVHGEAGWREPHDYPADAGPPCTVDNNRRCSPSENWCNDYCGTGQWPSGYACSYSDIPDAGFVSPRFVICSCK